ncbi:MAG: DUF6770 family protein [Chitinophagaceae bacterium]
MKNLFLVCCFLLLISSSGFSQTLSIENIGRITLRNSGAIKDGTDVKGYYFFYVSDKVDKNTYEYTLQITDNTLKKIKDIKFTDSKSVIVLESSFNGSDLAFMLYNRKTKLLQFELYGTDGKKKETYTRMLTEKDEEFLFLSYNMVDDEQQFKGLYPIEGKGFLSNTASREDKDLTFRIDFFSSEKNKQWSYNPTTGAKRFMGDFLGIANGIIHIEVLKFASLMDQKPESFLVGLDIETGKQVFEKSTEKSKYKFYPANMFSINGKSYLFGEYFDTNDNMFKDNSKGFAFWNLNEKGDIQSEKYCSWATDLSKYLNTTAKGKIDDFGYTYLHNIVQSSNGTIYAIGEGYKKVSSRLSIPKMKVTDLLLLKFDSEFNVTEANIYKKNGNTVEIASGLAFMSTPFLGKLLKWGYGAFDYAYTQTNKDGSSFTVCYSDSTTSKDYKGNTFNSISYNDGIITTDKIQIKSSGSRSAILPASQGQVLIMEYFEKEKRMELHFEKLN